VPASPAILPPIPKFTFSGNIPFVMLFLYCAAAVFTDLKGA
jgi:hypothetical protein